MRRQQDRPNRCSRSAATQFHPPRSRRRSPIRPTPAAEEMTPRTTGRRVTKNQAVAHTGRGPGDRRDADEHEKSWNSSRTERSTTLDWPDCQLMVSEIISLYPTTELAQDRTSPSVFWHPPRRSKCIDEEPCAHLFKSVVVVQPIKSTSRTSSPQLIHCTRIYQDKNTPARYLPLHCQSRQLTRPGNRYGTYKAGSVPAGPVTVARQPSRTPPNRRATPRSGNRCGTGPKPPRPSSGPLPGNRCSKCRCT